MGIALVIAGGLVLMTLIASGADYLTKRAKVSGGLGETRLKELEKRIMMLEQQDEDKNEKIEKLERDMGFINKLIEDKTQE